jgi:uncharacterized NAD-dependent epimerase/dehydratase family protein
MRIAVLAHGAFPGRAKTAIGLLRYGDYEPVALLDRENAGDRVDDHVPDLPAMPIVEDAASAPPFDVLAIGISPIGGAFDPSWRPDVQTAIERGADVWSGLHDFLADDEAFARLADEHGVRLRDVRRPPDDLTVSEGVAGDLDARIVLTVGTDCSVGKMTASMELVAAARERGIDAGFVPTGQTGVMIDGAGVVVDRVPADFVAGAVERMCEARADHDLLVVEGQGSITHPAYSAVTCAILHGAMPDAVVLCHEAGRERVHGYESFALPPVGEYATLVEDLAAPVARCEVAAGALNTSALDPDPARTAVEEYATALGTPATDPVRFDAGRLVEAVA